MTAVEAIEHRMFRPGAHALHDLHRRRPRGVYCRKGHALLRRNKTIDLHGHVVCRLCELRKRRQGRTMTLALVLFAATAGLLAPPAPAAAGPTPAALAGPPVPVTVPCSPKHPCGSVGAWAFAYVPTTTTTTTPPAPRRAPVGNPPSGAVLAGSGASGGCSPGFSYALDATTVATGDWGCIRTGEGCSYRYGCYGLLCWPCSIAGATGASAYGAAGAAPESVVDAVVLGLFRVNGRFTGTWNNRYTHCHPLC